MARKYVNPNGPAVSPVTDRLLDEARARQAAAAARLAEAERASPAAPEWDSQYLAATSAAAAADRRVEALERLRAAQVERGGARADAVKSAGLDATAAALAASRDQVSAAAAAHMKALAALVAAAGRHNAELAAAHARLATLGLRIRDDLVDDGAEHAEGCIESSGIRAAGIDWTRIHADGIAAHALRLVFAAVAGPVHPLAVVGKYQWRPHEVESRADGLRVPGLADARGLPKPPERPRVERMLPIDGTQRPPVMRGGYESDADARRRLGVPPRGR